MSESSQRQLNYLEQQLNYNKNNKINFHQKRFQKKERCTNYLITSIKLLILLAKEIFCLTYPFYLTVYQRLTT